MAHKPAGHGNGHGGGHGADHGHGAHPPVELHKLSSMERARIRARHDFHAIMGTAMDYTTVPKHASVFDAVGAKKKELVNNFRRELSEVPMGSKTLGQRWTGLWGWQRFLIKVMLTLGIGWLLLPTIVSVSQWLIIWIVVGCALVLPPGILLLYLLA